MANTAIEREIATIVALIRGSGWHTTEDLLKPGAGPRIWILGFSMFIDAIQGAFDKTYTFDPKPFMSLAFVMNAAVFLPVERPWQTELNSSMPVGDKFRMPI